jgi:hypothetical protein
MFGTNCPSITSICNQSTPARSVLFNSSPKDRKSNEIMDEEIIIRNLPARI